MGCGDMDEIKTLTDIFDMDLSKYGLRDEEVAEMERKQAEQAKNERYRKAVPERYWAESLETFKAESDEQRNALEQSKRYLEAVKCGKFCTLILLGSVGTGKTHLACGIVREFGGLYRLAPNIVEKIRRAKSFTAKDTEADILDGYGRAKLLVIDEIGRGVAGIDEQYMLYQIINERYNRRKPTVLISNQSKRDFLNYIGIAAADRLTESAKTVELQGTSYRATLRKKPLSDGANTAGV
jgi:DNA replication protein DnaC